MKKNLILVTLILMVSKFVYAYSGTTARLVENRTVVFGAHSNNSKNQTQFQISRSLQEVSRKKIPLHPVESVELMETADHPGASLTILEQLNSFVVAYEPQYVLSKGYKIFANQRVLNLPLDRQIKKFQNESVKFEKLERNLQVEYTKNGFSLNRLASFRKHCC